MTEVKEKREARQGATGHNVRYVLVISLALAAIVLAVIFFAYA